MSAAFVVEADRTPQVERGRYRPGDLRRMTSLTRASLTRLVALSALTLAAVAVSPPTAQACGGLFCNGTQPVNQTAERIVFAVNDDDTTSAIIEVRYSGGAMDFAWVLPVPGTPEVGVSSTAALDVIQTLTNPSYRMNVVVEGTCRERRSSGGGSSGFADAGTSADGAADSAASPPVVVLDSGAVGPFDYATISIDPSTEDPADAALTWLTDNGFVVTEMTTERLGPYLESGLNLVAFRLTKGNEVGAIRPIMLRYEGSTPMIPIRPTALAATDDMGILVWVLGSARAVPTNYLSLELNEARLDWFNPGSSYGPLVTLAADEAGGQGFVTEMAGSTDFFFGAVFSTTEETAWRELRSADWAGQEGALVERLIALYGAQDGAADALDATVPNLDDLMTGCGAAYWEDSCLSRIMDIEGLEPERVIEEFELMVVGPLRDTQAVLDGSRMFTRFFTTMSADEMTVDPFFDFNPDLSTVSNQHVATRTIECRSGVFRGDAPWRMDLVDGGVVRGYGSRWPTELLGEESRANRRILHHGTRGAGEVLEDNTAGIQALLADSNALRPPGSRRPGSGSPGACAVGGASVPASWLFSLVTLGLALRRWRRAR